jgi:hypothetical protein
MNRIACGFFARGDDSPIRGNGQSMIVALWKAGRLAIVDQTFWPPALG